MLPNVVQGIVQITTMVDQSRASGKAKEDNHDLRPISALPMYMYWRSPSEASMPNYRCRA